MVHLEKHVPAENQHRFYNLNISPDIFGGWLLVREYGRVGSPGRLLTNWFETQTACQKALESLLLCKKRRGYIETQQ